mmetsp:Transcript_76008/g.220776  ORF Transcript_76008/g.220776 Transcript_76008/m.220776 type:complete len:218 (+) Transcript_76008:82-735(+)
MHNPGMAPFDLRFTEAPAAIKPPRRGARMSRCGPHRWAQMGPAARGFLLAVHRLGLICIAFIRVLARRRCRRCGWREVPGLNCALLELVALLLVEQCAGRATPTLGCFGRPCNRWPGCFRQACELGREVHLVLGMIVQIHDEGAITMGDDNTSDVPQAIITEDLDQCTRRRRLVKTVRLDVLIFLVLALVFALLALLATVLCSAVGLSASRGLRRYA